MRFLAFIFSVALFCSAFLSFSVQPILGKMLLPLVGGAPAGWIVAMAFFQFSLLMGYGVSYLLGKTSPWVHAAGLLLLYAAGYLFLPPHLPADFNEPNIGLAVVKALARTIFVPFIALTATTAALQRVFAATIHPTAKDPYYLFVASNTGSFAGLLIYPFFLEPFTGLQWQAAQWQIIYLVAVAMILIACLVAFINRQKDISSKEQIIQERSSVTVKQMAYWVLLAFIPCSLSMGVTTLITTDLPGIPLFWVIPLGLYLLTFILAFAQNPYLPLRKLRSWQINAIGFWVVVIALGYGYKPTGNTILFVGFVLLLLEVFFVNALACHTELASLRPKVDRLPLYYFMLALGGSLAGIMHAFVLPFILKDVIEFPIVILFCLVLHPEFRRPVITERLKKFKKTFLVATIICLLAIIPIFVLRANHVTSSKYYWPLLTVFFISFMLVSGRPRILLSLGVVIFAGYMATHWPGSIQTTGRNFFGSYAVYDRTEGGSFNRYFVHGSTLHGIEPINKTDPNRYHVAYYAYGNPILDIIQVANAKSWGVIGLGSGQSACYDEKLTTDFYEIDPDVEKVARQYFTYLTQCPPRDVFIGDGRLKMQENDRRYDIILLDAFTGDGIPIHLLTKEALSLYTQHLNRNGVMLFHISNRYLELGPPIAAVAKENGLTAMLRIGPADPKYPLMQISKWVAVPMNQQTLADLKAKGWESIKPASHVWTDDQSSLLEAISPQPRFK